MAKRPRRKFLVILIAALMMFAVFFGLFIGKMQERKAFIGNLDPVTGYQCLFTLAAT